MPKEIKLDVQTREKKNGRAKELRTQGFIPAVLYGSGGDAFTLKVAKSDLEQAYGLAGETNLIDVIIDSKETVKVLIKEAQKDPVKDNILQVDFYRVDMNKPIEVEIPLYFTGESKAVKELGGTLIKNKDTIEVSCLPGSLVDNIEVDLSFLENFNDVIRIKDLNLPEDFTIKSHAEDTVVNVMEQKAEEEPTKEEQAGEEGEEKKEAGDAEKAGDEKPSSAKATDGKK